jgi:predicted amidohydrolase YtcJ
LEHFEKGAREMLRKGWQMNTHAIGDSANGMLLQLYARLMASDASRSDHRWRIEHAQLLSDADIQKLSELRLLPSVQPCHATSDLPWAAERLGEDRLQALGYRYAALAKSSPHLPVGTDVPVEPIDPRRTWEAGRNAGLQNAQIWQA